MIWHEIMPFLLGAWSEGHVRGVCEGMSVLEDRIVEEKDRGPSVP